MKHKAIGAHPEHCSSVISCRVSHPIPGCSDRVHARSTETSQGSSGGFFGVGFLVGDGLGRGFVTELSM